MNTGRKIRNDLVKERYSVTEEEYIGYFKRQIQRSGKNYNDIMDIFLSGLYNINELEYEEWIKLLGKIDYITFSRLVDHLVKAITLENGSEDALKMFEMYTNSQGCISRSLSKTADEIKTNTTMSSNLSRLERILADVKEGNSPYLTQAQDEFERLCVDTANTYPLKECYEDLYNKLDEAMIKELRKSINNTGNRLNKANENLRLSPYFDLKAKQLKK